MRSKKLIPAILVLICSLCITLFVYLQITDITAKRRLDEFHTKVNIIQYTLENRTKFYENILYSTQAFFQASSQVNRDEWRTFVGISKITDYPDIKFVSYIELVPAQNKLQFANEFRNDRSINGRGYPDFKIYPDTNNSISAVVKYIVPETPEVEKMYGFDLYTDKDREETLKRAAENNIPATTNIINIHPYDKDGFIMTIPIYSKDVSDTQPEERVKFVSGFVNVVLLTENILTGIISQSEANGLSLAVYDGEYKDGLHNFKPVFESNRPDSVGVSDNPEFSDIKTLRVGDHIWTVKYMSTNGFGEYASGDILSSSLLTSGIIFSLLLFFILYIQAKRSDDKVTEAEIKYQSLFETARDGLVLLDTADFKIIDVNPYFEKLLGYSKAELIGKNPITINWFQDREKAKNLMEKLVKNGHIDYENIHLVTKSGQRLTTEVVCNTIRVGMKDIINCSVRNVTERKKYQDELILRTKDLELSNKEQEQARMEMVAVVEDLKAAKLRIEEEKFKLEGLLEHLPVGVFMVEGTSGKVLIINPRGEELLGQGVKESAKSGNYTKIYKIIREDDQEYPEEELPVNIVLNTSKSIEKDDLFVRNAKGKKLNLHVIGVPVLGRDNKLLFVICVFDDVTREKEIDRAKSEFVSLASHQLRTPLGIAKWYIEAISTEKYFNKLPKIGKEYFNEIKKSNDRLLSLVKDLLVISRLDQGKAVSTPQNVDLPEFMKTVLGQLSIIAKKSDMNIVVTKEISDTKIFLDPMRLQEVIENLVMNAIQYSSASNTVELFTEVSGNFLKISIKDHGIGISSDDLKKIYKKFYRSEQAIKQNTTGSGLGLYVAKAYIEAWGGNISVESVEGKGSTFSFTIPISKEGENA